MSRRPLTPEEHACLVFAGDVQLGRSATAPNGSAVQPSSFYELPTGVRKKPTAAKRPRSYERAFAACVERGRAVLSGNGAPESAADLVGLYAVLHEHVFGLLPLELKQDYGAACSSADKLVRDEFAGDFAAAERFMAWCWKRTRTAVKRRQGEGEEPFRPGWRIQFKSRSWLVDFRASRSFKAVR